MADDKGAMLIPSRPLSQGRTEPLRGKGTFLESPGDFITVQGIVSSSLGAQAFICAPVVFLSTPACVYITQPSIKRGSVRGQNPSRNVAGCAHVREVPWVCEQTE